MSTPPQTPPPQVPEAPPADGAGSALWREARALFSLLFDLSFKQFLTPRLIRLLYVLSLLAAVLSALAWMASGFREGVLQGLFTLVTGPVAFFLYLLGARVVMEVLLAIFRIAERLDRSPPDTHRRP